MSLSFKKLTHLLSIFLNRLNRINILPLLVISFILGILCNNSFEFSFFITALVSALFLIFSFRFLAHPAKAVIFLLVSFFFLGCSVLANSNTLSSNHIKNLFKFKDNPYELTGTVISEPRLGKSKAQLKVNIKSICRGNLSLSTSGKILVRIDKDLIADLSYGDNIRLKGKIYRPFSFGDKTSLDRNSFNYREYLARKDIHFIINIKDASSLQMLDLDKRYFILRIAARISKRLNALLFSQLPPQSASFYAAMLLGRREALYSQLREVFAKSGTAHILAISGLHVGIIAFILILALKAFGLKRRARLIVSILALVFYCILSGMRPPVLRATIMAIFVLVGILIEREKSIYNCLSLAAFLILLFKPGYIFEVGFQLSFSAVLGIILFSSRLGKILENRVRFCLAKFSKSSIELPSFFSRLIYALSVSTCAYLSVMPLLIYHFKIITPLAILTNIFVIPALTIILALGFTFLVFASLIPPAGVILAAPLGMVAAILIHFVSFVSKFPGAYFYVTLKLSPCLIFSYYILLFLLIFALDKRINVLSKTPSNGVDKET